MYRAKTAAKTAMTMLMIARYSMSLLPIFGNYIVRGSYCNHGKSNRNGKSDKVDELVKSPNVSPRTKREVFQLIEKPGFLTSFEMTNRAFFDFLRDHQG